MSSIVLPKADNGFFSEDKRFDTSDITLPSSLGEWSDGVGAVMLDNVKRVVQDYNRQARIMWRNVEKLSRIKADVEPYESVRGKILDIRAAVKS